MGWKTDMRIAEFKARLARGEVSYEPAAGENLRLLEKLEQAVKDFAAVIPLEKTGERDGDGVWHGSDAVGGLFEDLKQAGDEFINQRT